MPQTVTLGGNPIQIGGTLPKTGDTAPAFKPVAKDLSEVSLDNYAGKRKVLNIFPSIDTPTCATSVRKFNARSRTTEEHRRAVHLGRPAFRAIALLRCRRPG